jgi:quinol monooxygenase YgiN
MGTPRVRMTAEWSVTRAEMGVMSAAVQSLMVVTRAEPGCVSCSLSTQLGERADFHYVEDWRTEDDLIAQIQSGRFGKLAQLLESAMERPRIEFLLPGGTRGIEYAEEVRGRKREVR